MKRVFRKNQMIITALALLIAVAGYISYTQANTDTKETLAKEETAKEQTVANEEELLASGDLLDISEEDLASAIFTDTEESEELASADNQVQEVDGSDVSEEDHSDAGTTVLTAAEASNVASQMKLNREQTRSKNKETLMDIVNNEGLSEAQKEDAIDQLGELTAIAEKESAAENLLLAKGFSDVVVYMTEDGVDVVLNMGDVTDAKRAQVEDIVKRKSGVDAENIVITPISK